MCQECIDFCDAIRKHSKSHPQYHEGLYLEQLYLLARWPDETHDLEDERAICWAASEINEATVYNCPDTEWVEVD